MSKLYEPSGFVAVAAIAGVPIDEDIAARIVRSIGPALDSFAPISGTLVFDLEPASFVVAQLRTQRP